MCNKRAATRAVALEPLEARRLFSGTAPDWFYPEAMTDVVRQPDGRIVGLGWMDPTPFSTSFGGFRGHFYVARYLPDGRPDPSFGQGGIALSNFDDFRVGRALALGPDGSVVVGGSVGRDAVVARFRADGSLDTSFGDGGKVVVPDLYHDSGDWVTDLVVLPGGGVAAAVHVDKFYPLGGPTGDVGRADTFFCVLRLTAVGRLDPGFGEGGKVLTPFLPPEEQRREGVDAEYGQPTGTILQTYETTTGALTAAPDGKLIVGGTVRASAAGGSIALARYNSDGSPDLTFGNGGRVVASEPPDVYASPTRLVVLPDGRLLAVGVANVVTKNENVMGGQTSALAGALAAFNADGSLDTTFGEGDGYVLDTGANFAEAVPAPGGTFYVTGRIGAGQEPVDTAPLLARYTAAGVPDNAFSTDGRVDFHFTGDADREAFVAAAVAPDGDVFAVGRAGERAGQLLGTVRFNADGSLDETLGPSERLAPSPPAAAGGGTPTGNPDAADPTAPAEPAPPEIPTGPMLTPVPSDPTPVAPPETSPGAPPPDPVVRTTALRRGPRLRRNGTLQIGGTDKSEVISVTKQGRNLRVSVDARAEVVAVGGGRKFRARKVRAIVVTGGGGDDVLSVAPDVAVRVTLDGGPGNDTLSGGAASDTLTGGDGDDFLYGGDGDDRLDGSAGNDHVGYNGIGPTISEPGNDVLTGGEGEDWMVGGAGADQISGGPGTDHFTPEDGDAEKTDRSADEPNDIPTFV